MCCSEVIFYIVFISHVYLKPLMLPLLLLTRMTPANSLLAFLAKMMLSDRNTVNSRGCLDFFGLGCSKTGVDKKKVRQPAL